MSGSRILLDPTAERAPMRRELLPRPTTLAGLTVGLLDISKARGDIFIEHLEGLLAEKGVVTRRYIKPTYARIAPIPLKQQIAIECDLLIEALAD